MSSSAAAAPMSDTGAASSENAPGNSTTKKTSVKKKTRTRTKKKASADAPNSDTPQKPKTPWSKIALRAIAAVLVLAVGAFGALYWYVASSFQPGQGGTLTETVATAPELREDIVNVLVLGIDHEEDNEREQSMGITREEENTDLILYVQFNKKENTLNMLQIPRDCFVGPYLDTGGYGRINALYWNAPDPDNRVQYLAECLKDQLGLTVDHYVTIDMDALRELVDTFGGGQGIEVYVPVTMEYDGSRLEKGYHILTGAELEFFLRQRKDSSATPRGDLDRLNNQRYFYSAIFKYMRTMTWQEMVKLMPLFRQYVNTDISAWDCAALAVSVMKVPNENIRMGRLPVYGAQALYNGQYVTGIAAQQTADLLNEYFHPADSPVSVDELNIYLPAPQCR
jgi:LCP family protein required for cell wall assembly